jgi:hypothetical protein
MTKGVIVSRAHDWRQWPYSPATRTSECGALVGLACTSPVELWGLCWLLPGKAAGGQHGPTP